MVSRPFNPVRCFEPLLSGLWILFLIWTAWIACVWTFAIGDDVLLRWIGNADLRAALEWIIGIGDVAWITLAAANVHLWLAETEGLSTARRWALIVLGGVMAIATASALRGWPLGLIEYSHQLGMKLGPIPVGLPLLWYALIIGGRQMVLLWWPGAGHLRLALGGGAVALLADLNIEPVAAKLRGFWFWRAEAAGAPPHFAPPWTSFPAWFIAAGAFTYLLREERVAVFSRRAASRPALIFLVVNAVFLAANLGRFLRP